ncbi:MAG: hypothetical protein SOR80_05365 [Enterococcus cecorum]|nr:hypothetical protein [Enterococcus cecorum]
MFQYFEQSKLSKHLYLSIPVIFLGIVGSTTSILPGKLAIFNGGFGYCDCHSI